MESAGISAVVSAPTMTRPADTTAYASGDLVANNTSAGSVTPLEFAVARDQGRPVTILRARVMKSGTGVTNAAFRLHLFRQLPTAGVGDNAAFASNKAADYIGSLDITSMNAFSDGAVGIGAPLVGTAILTRPVPGSHKVYGLLEARGAYTPGNAETFVVSLEAIQD